MKYAVLFLLITQGNILALLPPFETPCRNALREILRQHDADHPEQESVPPREPAREALRELLRQHDAQQEQIMRTRERVQQADQRTAAYDDMDCAD